MAGVALFAIAGIDAMNVERWLSEHHLVHLMYRQVKHLEALRVSPHISMRMSELDVFIAPLDKGRQVAVPPTAGR